MSELLAREPAGIRVEGVDLSYGATRVLKDVNLEIRPGEFFAFLGPSGCGKTTLLNIVAGFLRPTSGSVVGAKGKVRGPGADRGMVFQQGALFSSLSVLENVASPLVEHTDLPKSQIYELAEMKIAMVGLKPEARYLKPAELSGGMRKRVGLARALALDPELLFLDEPTAGLDPIGAAAFDELIRNLSDDLGLTVFMITHDLDSLYAICDKVAVLADKGIVAKAPVQELERSDHPWIKEYFLGPRGRAGQKAA